LYLSGNTQVGDAGTVALVAAIRTCPPGVTVFDVLDLSACDVGDAGAQALALALESHPNCIRRLILSHNQIGNEGVEALCRSLSGSGSPPSMVQALHLDNNPGVGNAGANAIARVVEKGGAEEISLRSCSIFADGASALGKALQKWAIQSSSKKKKNTRHILLDLSGNPLGKLRKKKKKQKKLDEWKNKASETTATYFNWMGKKIQSGLKDVGLDGLLRPPTVESDDDEEERMSAGSSKPNDDDIDPSKAPCGVKAFCSAFMDDESKYNNDNNNKENRPPIVSFHLGMRHCFMDEFAANALAAAIVHAKEHLGMNLVVDATMNQVLEKKMEEALRGNAISTLEHMADRHMDALETLRLAEERATQAAAAAAARRRRREEEWREQRALPSLEEDDEDEDEDYGFGDEARFEGDSDF